MFKRLTHGLLLFSLLFVMGGQWAVLQSIAWTTMLAANLHSTSLQAAVSKTFDGKHPCCLCKVVQTGRNSEHKKEFISFTLKLEFPPLNKTPALTAPSPFQSYPTEKLSAELLARQPATPPPRGVIA